MNPKEKTLLYIVGYCAILWLTNWTWTHYGTLELRGLGALFGIIISIVLTRKIWCQIRSLLAQGITIPRELRLWGDWRYLLLLFPLAVGYTYQASGTANDGTAIHTVFQYGGAPSGYSILFSALAIMLFQTLVNLNTFTCGISSESDSKERK